MKIIWEELEWIFDYYIAFFLYNPKKIHRYNLFMQNKWDFLPEQPYRTKKIQFKGVEKSTVNIFPEFDSAEQPEKNGYFILKNF